MTVDAVSDEISLGHPGSGGAFLLVGVFLILLTWVLKCRSNPLADGVEQDMDISCSSLCDIFSQDDAGRFTLPSVSQDCPDLQLYEHILKLFLRDLGKSDLLVRDVPKPRSFWEVETEELSTAFLKP